ncbi:MAG: single-stranded-DNA-specific exonuclease RecJ [Clostridia bacterium]|nr:single-stranded-DNA-specific exonuclease RecJ [Clostridia bacterium]
MQEKIWEYRNKQLKKEEIDRFAATYKVPPAIAVIMMNRGITSEQVVGSYMKKSLESIHNPFLLCDMEEATERILRAVENKEKTVIYGDYDVDGITATATLYKFLKNIGANVSYYIPDRFSEGYGINIMAVNKLARQGVGLMITVDCGITAVGEVEFAKTQGMDIVITDHHTCREELPKAVAVINPKRADSTYPFDGLAGVGVAFKLVLALAIKLGMSTKEVFLEYADMVAIGTVADVVPLLDENRIIVDKGIKAIQSTKNKGVNALIKAVGLSRRTLDSTMISFSLAPRLNVAGRLESAKIAVELMICEDEERAREIAEYLNETNCKRQEIEKNIYDDAIELVSSFEKEQLVYVLAGEGWHHGVIGIVASRLCEKLYRPCVLISKEGGKGKGSGRSVEEVNLFEVLSDSEEILTAFGGHTMAAGLTVSVDRIDELRERVNAYVKKNIDVSTLVPKLKIDCNLESSSININAAKMIAKLEPFGEGNENPVFSAHGMRILSVSTMGPDSKHLRLRLTDGKETYNAVGFNMGEFCDEFNPSDVVSIAFNMNINIYQGSENLQLLVKDIKK